MPGPGSWTLLPTTYPSLAGDPLSPTLRPPACQVLCGAMLGTGRQAPGLKWGQTWMGSHHPLGLGQVLKQSGLWECVRFTSIHTSFSLGASQALRGFPKSSHGACEPFHQLIGLAFVSSRHFFPPFQLCGVKPSFWVPPAPCLSSIGARSLYRHSPWSLQCSLVGERGHGLCAKPSLG